MDELVVAIVVTAPRECDMHVGREICGRFLLEHEVEAFQEGALVSVTWWWLKPGWGGGGCGCGCGARWERCASDIVTEAEGGRFRRRHRHCDRIRRAEWDCLTDLVRFSQGELHEAVPVFFCRGRPVRYSVFNQFRITVEPFDAEGKAGLGVVEHAVVQLYDCLLYTSPSPRD